MLYNNDMNNSIVENKYKRWTEEDISILKMGSKEGWGSTETARRLKRAVQSVKVAASNRGLSLFEGRSKRWTEKEIAIFNLGIKERLDTSEIARRVDKSTKAVQLFAFRNGIKLSKFKIDTDGFSTLPSLIRAILLGSILGDGSVPKMSKQKHCVFSETHGIKQEKYLLAKAKLLGAPVPENEKGIHR